MRALVTGCAGFIGSHLGESLLADGHEVVGLDCFSDNYSLRRKLLNLKTLSDWESFEFLPLDIARGGFASQIADCDTIFHLSAEPGVRPSWGSRFENYVRNNVLATQVLLEAAHDVGVNRFVYASSSSVYGQAETLPTSEDTIPRPLSPYGVTKLCAEHLCNVYHANRSTPTVSLRFFTVFGPRQRPDMAFASFCSRAIRKEPIVVFGDGNQSRDFTYVADVVTAVRSAARSPAAAGNVYNVGGGFRLSINDSLALIEGFCGRGLDIQYHDKAAGDVRDTGADTSRARADLGFDPQTLIRDGLAAEFQWTLENLASL